MNELTTQWTYKKVEGLDVCHFYPPGSDDSSSPTFTASPSSIADQILKRMNTPGPTGRFPEGKLHKGDRGELAVKISKQNDTIIVDFNTMLDFIALNKDQAINFAKTLVEYAMKS